VTTVTLAGVGKRYRKYEDSAVLISRGRDRVRRTTRSDIWALRGIDLDIEPRDCLGVIGRNGGGKTTMLQLLAGVSAPTEGRVSVRGRVAPLMAVGVGFHPELTGRENVYINATILGMERAEIDEAFADIVAFSDIGDFIDTPVKFYSSGMMVRLGMSVAVRSQPDILLVDEVLAVGDQSFQERCLGRMGEYANDGRTVIFVSHNLGALARLCDRCIWLDHGKLMDVLPTKIAIERYLAASSGSTPMKVIDRDLTRAAQYEAIEVTTTKGTQGEISCDEAIRIRLTLRAESDLPGLHAAVLIQTSDGVPVLFSDSRDAGGVLPAGTSVLEVEVPERLLAPGRYSLTAGIATPYLGLLDRHEGACSFRLVDHETERGDDRPGVLSVRLPWTVVDHSGDMSAGGIPSP
jgi:lipopolysaccharide transport system ATP-binding protein